MERAELRQGYARRYVTGLATGIVLAASPVDAIEVKGSKQELRSSDALTSVFEKSVGLGPETRQRLQNLKQMAAEAEAAFEKRLAQNFFLIEGGSINFPVIRNYGG